jgi:hypothetical protein
VAAFVALLGAASSLFIAPTKRRSRAERRTASASVGRPNVGV